MIRLHGVCVIEFYPGIVSAGCLFDRIDRILYVIRVYPVILSKFFINEYVVCTVSVEF